MPTPAPRVDIPRYMGDWYVIAVIPTRLEKDAFNAVESYRLDDDGSQVIWPIRSDYRIAWIADDYSQVVVAREKRDYLWIMARTPEISAQDLTNRKAFAAQLGYDLAKIQDVPQRAGKPH